MNELVLLIKKGANRTLCYAIMLGCFLGVQYRSLTARLDSIESRLENLERAVAHRSVSTWNTNSPVSIRERTFRSELAPTGYSVVWGAWDFMPFPNGAPISLPLGKTCNRVTVHVANCVSSNANAITTKPGIRWSYKLKYQGITQLIVPMYYKRNLGNVSTEFIGWNAGASGGNPETGHNFVWGERKDFNTANYSLGVPTYTANNCKVAYTWFPPDVASIKSASASDATATDTAESMLLSTTFIVGASTRFVAAIQTIPRTWDIDCDEVEFRTDSDINFEMSSGAGTNLFAMGMGLIIGQRV